MTARCGCGRWRADVGLPVSTAEAHSGRWPWPRMEKASPSVTPWGAYMSSTCLLTRLISQTGWSDEIVILNRHPRHNARLPRRGDAKHSFVDFSHHLWANRGSETNANPTNKVR